MNIGRESDNKDLTVAIVPSKAKATNPFLSLNKDCKIRKSYIY